MLRVVADSASWVVVYLIDKIVLWALFCTTAIDIERARLTENGEFTALNYSCDNNLTSHNFQLSVQPQKELSSLLRRRDTTCDTIHNFDDMFPFVRCEKENEHRNNKIKSMAMNVFNVHIYYFGSQSSNPYLLCLTSPGRGFSCSESSKKKCRVDNKKHWKVVSFSINASLIATTLTLVFISSFGVSPDLSDELINVYFEIFRARTENKSSDDDRTNLIIAWKLTPLEGSRGMFY